MSKLFAKRMLAFALATAMMFSFLPWRAQAAENENLALGKNVAVSSYEPDTQYDGNKIVDGDRSKDSRWGTAQNVAAGEWAEIDLGAATPIKQIDIYFERSDAEQNILSFKVEIYANGEYETVYTKNQRASHLESIVMSEAKEAQKVKITVLDADGGSLNWVNVGISEVEIYGDDHVDELPGSYENIALGKPATASNVESGTTNTADKAVDGNTSNSSRWATNQNVSNPWIEIDLDDNSTVKQVDIYFERADADQNILAFKIEVYDDGAYKTVYTHAESNGRAKQHEKIILSSAVTADKIKLTVTSYDGGQNPVWKCVSITEIEVYSAESSSINDVIDILNNQSGSELSGDTFQLPAVPDGYTIKLNGSDYEQVISKDLLFVRPLVDKVVSLSYEVTDSQGKTAVTGDIPYIVKGQYTQDPSNNAKPQVIPEIQEWYSDTAAKLEVSDLTKVTYDNVALKAVVDEFVSDYEAFTGVKLTATQGAAQAGAFNFSMTAPDAILGAEGYTMEIKADRIDVASGSVTGNMYGMQTILQMYKLDPDVFPMGTMRDYPRFQVRGLLLDIARKPIAMTMVRYISRTMRYYKMNDLQLHLNDNYIWLEEYGTYADEDNGFNAYEAFRLESSLTNAAGEDPSAEDYAIDKETMRLFIQSERALGMNIVPEIDVPAHAMSFTKVWPELSVDNYVHTNGHTLIDHFNLNDPAAVAKIKEIFDDYTKPNGDIPATFDSETVVHIGADEFYLSGKTYREFFNEMVPYIKQTNTIRLWGSLTAMNDNNQTKIIPEAIEDVQMNLWSAGWANFRDMFDMGFHLINTIDTYGYMVPNGIGNRGAYGDYLNLNDVFNNFKPNKVGSIELPASDDQILGAAFAIWNDNIDRKSCGLTESDTFARFFDALPFYAEKNWATTGQEKGSATVLTALAQKIGIAPNVNPYFQVESKGDVHEKYTFDDMTDSSENGRDLIAGTATLANSTLVLAGGNSYIGTPIEKIGNGNVLSFDITLTEAAQPGDILFECTPEYGTHDIRIMDDGRLGFTRELHEYYFNYTLPVNTKVNIRIETAAQDTSLYVNGELVGTASGRFVHNGEVKKNGIGNDTFALPLERIGSKTNSIAAVIDNVLVEELFDTSDDSRDIPIPVLSVTAGDYEPDGGESEGPAELVLDEDENTLWHTDWYGTSRDDHWIQFALSEDYIVDGLRYLPRKGSNNGTILEYEIQVSDDGVNFRTVSTGTWGNNKNWKIASFEGIQTKFVRLVAKNTVADSDYVFASAAEIRLTGVKAEEHVHVFDKRVASEDYLASEATCDEAASYYFSCACGEKGTGTFVDGESLGHADADKDHVCDNNCGVPQGEHKAAEGSHECGYCGETITECADTDKDHNCDTCGKKLSDCGDTKPADHKCDICGKVLSTCADKNEDGKCDVCGVITVPAKPYKITNVVSGVHVYWKAVPGAAKYGLWRSETGKNGSYKWIANPTVPHFTDTKVESGKIYYYKVTTMVGTSHSEKSDAIGVIYVGTPDITSRVNKAAGITVGWNKIEGAQGYAIYRKSYSGTDAWVRVGTISGNETFTWTDTSVKNANGTTYKYTVRALAGSDMKTLSGCRNTGRTMARLTSRVLNSAVKASATSIKCSWTTSSVVTGYEVRFMVGSTVYKTFTVGDYKIGVKTFTGLKAGQTYKIQVRSYLKVDGMGFYSAWSTAKTVTLP